jgi:hypothetical protein
LTEEIYFSSELVLETGHSKIKALDPPDENQHLIIEEIDRAMELVSTSNDDGLGRRILQSLVPEYHPASDVSAFLDPKNPSSAEPQ